METQVDGPVELSSRSYIQLYFPSLLHKYINNLMDIKFKSDMYIYTLHKHLMHCRVYVIFPAQFHINHDKFKENM